ncbi:hypothetical protein ACFTSF_32420 [Kribbella sp. NPDC056951]|uniref:hypothetical protein n=1 Tax=Kribbella sp. NPDC056951 TaxID=3345978 RepID=UPI0036384BA1
MTRRKVFDPNAVPISFWRGNDVQTALARRDIGALFRSYLAAFDDCTQTQLALLTEHDRSDVSNWVRGARHGQVSDIGVLTRIAEGLRLPDTARMLMGLAPADALMSSIRDEREMADSARMPADQERRRLDGSEPGSTRIAICGSRTSGVHDSVVDAAVRALARLVMVRRLRVNHGPVGVGIEVMTHIADHYQPPGLRGAVAIFGRRNVISDAEYVVVVGGGSGTRAEADLAIALGKRVLPYGASGGTARAMFQQVRRHPPLTSWISSDQLAKLDSCASLDSGASTMDIEQMTDDFVELLDNVVHTEGEPRV